MTRYILLLSMVLGASHCTKYLQTSEVQLAPPLYSVDSVLFLKEATILAQPPIADASIRYANGDENLPKAWHPEEIAIHENANIGMQAYHDDFLPSEEVQFKVRKVACPDVLVVKEGSTAPKAPYTGEGLISLVDLRKGDKSFSGDNRWLGFQQEEVVFRFDIGSPTHCSTLTVSTLSQHAAWIFSPASIEVWSGQNVIGSIQIDVPQSQEPTELLFWDIALGSELTDEVEVRIRNLSQLPSWHAGAGSDPWLFVDEIFLH